MMRGHEVKRSNGRAQRSHEAAGPGLGERLGCADQVRLPAAPGIKFTWEANAMWRQMNAGQFPNGVFLPVRLPVGSSTPG